MTDTAPLTQTLNPQVCAKVIATMAPVIHDKICRAFAAALDAGYVMVGHDGHSPAGEHVISLMNADMARLGFSPEAVRIMRLNVRVIGLTLIREAYVITRRAN